jgi:beta-lactamase class A
LILLSLYNTLSQIAENFSGTFTVHAEHLETGEVIAFGNPHPMETASTIKLPILITAMQKIHEGKLRLEQPVPLLSDDYVTGSGVLQNLGIGTVLPLADVLMLMIIVSDNMATNMVLRLIGLDAVNRLMQDFGARSTVIRKRIDFHIPPPIGLSTPKDMVHLLKGIYHREIISPTVSQWIWDVLIRQQYNTLLTRLMPYNLLNSETENPPQVIIGSKSGSVEGVRNDVGIVTTPWGDYAIAIMSEGCQDLRFHVDNEAHRVLPEAALRVFQHFCPQAF